MGLEFVCSIFLLKNILLRKGEYFLSEDVISYINLTKIYEENKASIVSDQPHLEKVEYTDDKEKLFPKIKTESFHGAVELYLAANSMSDIKANNLNFTYSFKDLGKYKRKNWEFQKEWRYIITLSPMGLQEANPPSFAKQQEQIRRIENLSLEPPYKQIFLDIDSDALKDIEIVFGPKMSEAEKIMAKTLIKEYCPEATYRDSILRIG